jgi:hypothetical protein
VTLRHRPFFRVNPFLVVTSNGTHVTIQRPNIILPPPLAPPPLPSPSPPPLRPPQPQQWQWGLRTCVLSPLICFLCFFFFVFLLTILLCSTGDTVMAWLVLAPTNDAGPGGDPPSHNGVLFFSSRSIKLIIYFHILYRHHHDATLPSPSPQQQDGDDETRTTEWDQRDPQNSNERGPTGQ